MTAKDIMRIPLAGVESNPVVSVDSTLPVLEVLPKLLESPQRELGVMENGEYKGTIDRDSLLEGLSRLIVARDDCSVITLECAPENYSAGIIAHAVEDTDAHLVDLLSAPTSDGKIRVTLRLRHSDPTLAARNLERYDYEVLEAHGSGDAMQSLEIATERLLSLQALMNV